MGTVTLTQGPKGVLIFAEMQGLNQSQDEMRI